jgi:NAD(P)-dependent dehydrogenase (short-subunit alcohol dehydrogenase family)
VNTTSVAGLVGNFGQANYAAAKAGVYALTRVGALELAKAGIRVNAIAPVALTRMTADLPVMSGATEAELGPRFVAPAVVWLASDLAAGITGEIVGVEGSRLCVYRMEATPQVEGDWTPEGIAARWGEIARG